MTQRICFRCRSREDLGLKPSSITTEMVVWYLEAEDASFRVHAPRGRPFPLLRSVLPSSLISCKLTLFGLHSGQVRRRSGPMTSEIWVLPDAAQSDPCGCSGHRCLCSIRTSGEMRWTWRSRSLSLVLAPSHRAALAQKARSRLPSSVAEMINRPSAGLPCPHGTRPVFY